MIIPQVLSNDQVETSPTNAMLHDGKKVAYRIMSTPYVYRDQWYVNIIDIFSLKNHSIKLEDIKNFSILGKLSHHFTKVL